MSQGTLVDYVEALSRRLDGQADNICKLQERIEVLEKEKEERDG